MSILDDKMRKEITDHFPRYPKKQAVTLPALHIVHDKCRSVPMKAIEEIADLLELQPAQVHDTLSFYGFFRPESNPLGKYRVWVCRSLSCALRGGEELLAELSKKLDCEPGGTSPDGRFSLESAECLGACEGAPCLLVNDDCHMSVTPKGWDAIERGLDLGEGSNGQKD